VLTYLNYFEGVPNNAFPVSAAHRQVVLPSGLTTRINSDSVCLTDTPTASPKVDQVVITPNDEGKYLLYSYTLLF